MMDNPLLGVPAAKAMTHEERRRENDLNRVRIVRLRPCDVLTFFFQQNNLPACISLPEVCLPAGFQVVSIHEDYLARCFVVMVQHPSFDVVPPGEIPPAVDAAVRWNFYDLKRPAVVGTSLAPPAATVAPLSGDHGQMKAAVRANVSALYDDAGKLLAPKTGHLFCFDDAGEDNIETLEQKLEKSWRDRDPLL